MSDWRLSRVFLIGVCGISLFILADASARPAVTQAETAQEIEVKIAEQHKRIADLQAEIARYQKELNKLSSKKNTLQSTVNTLSLEQKQLATKIQVTRNKIDAATLEINELTAIIRSTESSIETGEDAIAKALRTMEEQHAYPLIIRLFQSESLGDAWHMVDEVSELTRALRKNIYSLTEAKQRLAKSHEDVSETKNELMSLGDQLSTEKRSVDANKRAQQDLLTQTKNQEAAYQKILADKRAEEAAFQARLFELASQLKFVVDPSRIPPAGKGVLAWPLDAVFVTQQFGKTADSGRLYTSGTHDGVDFRASVGTPVRAAGSGIVSEINLGAVQNCQYGKWILIKHDNGLATLYAHLSSIQAQKGSAVTRGQVIGYAGNTGYATGPHLHFTTYLAEAVSFKQYTCKSGYTVTVPIAPPTGYLDPMSYL